MSLPERATDIQESAPFPDKNMPPYRTGLAVAVLVPGGSTPLADPPARWAPQIAPQSGPNGTAFLRYFEINRTAAIYRQ